MSTRSYRGRGVAALVAVAAVVVVIAVGGVVWSRRSHGPVVFVGDSITDQARPLIESRFGVDDNALKAVPGKTIVDMMDAARGLAATDPRQAVIDLGTNDVLAGEPAEANGAALTQMVDLFPTARCVHLVTINEHMLSPSQGNVGAGAAALDQQMQAIAQSHPNVRIIDWDKVVLDYDAAGDPNGPVTIDTVHPTAVGQQMLVDAMEQSVQGC